MHDHSQDSRSTTPAIHEPVCRYPGSTSCRGCTYSYDPSAFDGGCLAAYTPEERERIRQTTPLPPRRV